MLVCGDDSELRMHLKELLDAEQETAVRGKHRSLISTAY
jgi:hypothetical protein